MSSFSRDIKVIRNNMNVLRFEMEFFLERLEEADPDFPEVINALESEINTRYKSFLAYDVLLKMNGALAPDLAGNYSLGSEADQFFSKEEIRNLMKNKVAGF